ncbi:hypothetical protein B0T10DRAFT_476105 [Thelonectria olida]|uniref:Flavin reductase like domain-containing protein n=1 Tax=Thelonectria olida TaxID=1576542 RepID=A0A9P9ARV7_9HYPO|nr:hypothetical protein B0T10DRAFT_476105 [Thelonectria olida]
MFRNLHSPRLPIYLVRLSSSPFNVTKRLINTTTRTMADSAKRNPHPDFKATEAARPDWDSKAGVRFTKTPDPDWKLGSGANKLGETGPSKAHIAIDPHAPGRSLLSNYKFLISSIVPRPIAFVSSRAADGSAVNLAPFSWFNMINYDPPMFIVSVASPLDRAKDTLRNLVDSRECVINIISEPFIEAANATCVNAPYGVSEWDVSGLTPAYDCETVACARVREAIVSVEAKLHSVQELDSKAQPGQKSCTLLILEGTRFWVREDATNEDKSLVDPDVLRPISRLGGITYGRTTDLAELPRTDFDEDVGGLEGYENIKNGN